MPAKILSLFSSSNRSGKQLKTYLKSILGFAPGNVALYQLALVHQSAGKTGQHGARESNERLEYLGDAILGSIVAVYLFKKFPYKDEGFLTEIRSRLVSRESLNKIGYNMGLAKMIVAEKGASLGKSACGDALEALVGAVYLDKGYSKCRTFVINQLIERHFDLQDVINQGQNAKSKLLEWSQKEAIEVNFSVEEIKEIEHRKEFVVMVTAGDQQFTGFGSNKKKAEQDAAQKALDGLNLS